jgi:hypothetical protein
MLELLDHLLTYLILTYFKKTERKALLPDGKELEFEDFINVVKDNLQTKESLKEVSNKKVKEILTGGPEDLLDGPPCLQMICKQVQESGNKLKDERDRFLFNYMVFVKFYLTIWCLLKRNTKMIGRKNYYRQLEIL